LVWLGSAVNLLFFSELSQSRWSWLWLILAMGIFILGSIYADDFAVPRNVGGFAVAFLAFQSHSHSQRSRAQAQAHS